MLPYCEGLKYVNIDSAQGRNTLQFLIACAVSYHKKNKTFVILFHMPHMIVMIVPSFLVFVRDRKPKKNLVLFIFFSGCWL